MLSLLLIVSVLVTADGPYTFAPPGKGVRVELPMKPTSSSASTSASDQGQVKLTSAEVKLADRTYSVQISESGDSVDAQALDEMIQEYVAEHKATVGPIKPVTVDRQVGREFEMTEPTGLGDIHTKARWVSAGKRLIVLTVVCPPNTDLPPDTDKFLGTLKISAPGVVEQARAKRVADSSLRAFAAEALGVPEPDQPNGAKREAAAAPEKNATAESEKKAPPAAKKKAPPVKFTISKLPKNAKPYPLDSIGNLPESFDKEKDGFRDVGMNGSLLVGMRVSFVEKLGGPKIGSVLPMYRAGMKYYEGQVHGQMVAPVVTVVAKPGYAVGGLITHTGLGVDGFSIVFMKVVRDALDPDDAYESPWIGDEKGGNPGEVFSKRRLVVGLQGRSEKDVNRLGLIVVK